jgi:ADP-heptose:LPS heptosyltransferase
MTSLEETIHLFDEIDLLVSVDTSVVHLAGSAGVPTYLLVDEMCDWRWGSNESVSDWYPSVQIFRKTNGQSYKDLISEVYKKIRSA